MPTCVFCEQSNSLGTSQCQNCGAPLPSGEDMTLEEQAFHAHLLELLARGEKIGAIAAYGRRSGCDLATAKEFVEALDSDQQFATARPIADVEREVAKLLERNEKINAVKVYRERTGVGLKEAKDEVEAIEFRLGLRPDENVQKGGCAGMLLLILLGSCFVGLTM